MAQRDFNSYVTVRFPGGKTMPVFDVGVESGVRENMPIAVIARDGESEIRFQVRPLVLTQSERLEHY